MSELISISEAAKILDLSISAAAYYVDKKALRFEYSNQRTSGRRQKRLVYREEVEALKGKLRPLASPPVPSSGHAMQAR